MKLPVRLRLFLGAIVSMVLLMPGCAESDAPRTPSIGQTEDPAPADVDGQAAVNALAPSAPGSGDISQTLTIGDKAPPLSIAAWVMGEPVADLQEDQVYVVEFWATWCPPCRTSMPHLSRLQEEYADQVHFIGVSDEDVDTVNQFLDTEESRGKTWREVVKYRMAIDDANGTSNDYMRAASQNGIPCAFIVGRSGLVEWIGHPMSMDQPLAKIVAGEWDRHAALVAMSQQQRVEELRAELEEPFRAQQWDAALDKIAEVEKEVGSNASITSLKMLILKAAGKPEEAAALQAELVEQRWDDPTGLNEIAWSIATGSGERNLPLALKAAQRANALTEEQNGPILDTLARVYFEQGDLDQAVLWQRKAVEHADGHQEILDALKRYEASQTARDTASDAAPATEEAKTNATTEDSSPANK
jgi:thiol-disulfide isomerase/thioredoxin